MAALELPSKRLTVLKGHSAPVECVRFTADGNYVLSGSQDKTIRLWNPAKGLQVKSFTGSNHEVTDIAITRDNGSFYSCGGDKAAFLWNVTAGSVQKKFAGHHMKVNCLALNEPENVLFTGSNDKTVRLWDLKAGGKPNCLHTLADATDSITAIVVTKHEVLTGSVDGSVRRYDLRKAACVVDEVHEAVGNVALSNDGECILVSTLDSKIRLFSKDSGDVLATYCGHTNKKYRVSALLDPTDAYVISGSEDGRIFAWDLVEAKVVRELQGHRGPVVGLAVQPLGAFLVSASADCDLSVWGK